MPLKLIENFYGLQRAERSGVPLIAHIYDGVEIITKNYPLIDELSFSEETLVNAFCLHPLLQSPKDLGQNLHSVMTQLGDKFFDDIRLAVEYRNLANSYLCKPSTDVYTKDSLRRLLGFYSKDVALLLLADKEQNLSDFKLFHYGYHERSEQLLKYFENWISVLEETLWS